MTWWNRKSKPEDAPEFVYGLPGTIIPAHDPKTAIVVPPPDPEPDLSTKPKDIIGYCFGYVCPKKHVGETFENISVDGYKQRRACQKCGGVAKPAVVKRTAEAKWGDISQPGVSHTPPRSNWGWYNSYLKYFGRGLNLGNIFWTRSEFVHFLDKPVGKK